MNTAIIDGQTPCPNDPDFVHEGYMYGCVPKDFSMRTGRSKTHHQTETVVKGLPWRIWMWNGGCDLAGVTAENRLAEYNRRDCVIILRMTP